MGKSMATETKETKTKAQRALELKAKLASLEEEAKTELLETANQTIKELADLGFTYHLLSDAEFKAHQTSNPAPGRPKSPKPPKDPSVPPKPCKQCGSLEHDARFHRAENIARKKAEAQA